MQKLIVETFHKGTRENCFSFWSEETVEELTKRIFLWKELSDDRYLKIGDVTLDKRQVTTFEVIPFYVWLDRNKPCYATGGFTKYDSY